MRKAQAEGRDPLFVAGGPTHHNMSQLPSQQAPRHFLNADAETHREALPVKEEQEAKLQDLPNEKTTQDEPVQAEKAEIKQQPANTHQEQPRNAEMKTRPSAAASTIKNMGEPEKP